MLQVLPLSLYVHFPFCVHKCPYCDFNSHKAPSQIPEQAYIEALLQDLALDLKGRPNLPLVSIFLGGGTPSLFSPESIAALLTGIKAKVAFAPDIEITLEANPGTIEHGQFAAYRAAGINRISLGAQSFNDTHLRKLGRIHSAKEITTAVEEIQRAGFDNFNLDLMYGLPQQTLAEAQADIRAAMGLQPAHLSHYQLTLEPGTAFYYDPPVLPQSDETYAMQVACQSILSAHGFEQYEVSAYARRGHQSVHNRNYWQFGDYIGIGAGAHGKLTEPARNRVMRTERCKQPREYLAVRIPQQRLLPEKVVAAAELPFEFMLNALRLNDGFTRKQFEVTTGQSWTSVVVAIAAAEAKGLLTHLGRDHWRPTELGRRFLNDLQALFLAA
ncbi:MAG TPA: radical SAM family heme chaperone HemW [Steroidobacteraceae bacterium]|nr:radical SAM family heme chaperone HemW [Steroidobacteraceae bacterium]